MIYKVQKVKNLEFPVIAQGECALVAYTDKHEFLEVVDTGSERFCTGLKSIREVRAKIRSVHESLDVVTGVRSDLSGNQDVPRGSGSSAGGFVPLL